MIQIKSMLFLFACLQERQTDEVKDWSSLVEEGEELIHLSNSVPASIKNIQVFCFTRYSSVKSSRSRL